MRSLCVDIPESDCSVSRPTGKISVQKKVLELSFSFLRRSFTNLGRKIATLS